MKTIRRWAVATVVGVLLLGLVGVVSAAPASAATRGFLVVNQTSYVLTVQKIEDNGGGGFFGRCAGGDEFAPAGTQVATGQTYRYEKVWHFNANCKTTLTIAYTDQKGSAETFTIQLMVTDFGNPSAVVRSHPHIAVADTVRADGRLVLTNR